jgi:hypothetical protein
LAGNGIVGRLGLQNATWQKEVLLRLPVTLLAQIGGGDDEVDPRRPVSSAKMPRRLASRSYSSVESNKLK